MLLPDTPLYMEGRISRVREEDQVDVPDGEDAPPKEVKFIVEKVMLLSDACMASSDPVCIDIACGGEAAVRLPQLKEVLGKHKGRVPVHVMLHLGDSWCRMKLSPAHMVTPGPYLEQDLSQWSRTAP